MIDETYPEHQRIVDWIDCITDGPPPEPDTPTVKPEAVAPANNKLKRRWPWSPSSLVDMSSPSKRRRPSISSSLPSSSNGHMTDVEDTPRLNKTRRPNLPPRTPSQASKAASVRSGASPSRISPSKQVADRQNKESPVVVCQYDPEEPGLPASLHRLWSDLNVFATGTGVISKSKQAEVLEAKATSARFKTSIVGDWVFGDAPARDQLGPSPTVAQVLGILSAAKTCANEKYCEASWNICTHRDVLQLALPMFTAAEDSVFFMPCPTAKIIDKYIDARGPSRKVDFCFVIEPGPQAADAISAIQHNDDLLSRSINHTDYQPLSRRPIGLSIESKAEGQRLNDAHGQLLIWLEAQWRLLRRLASRVDPPHPLPDFLPAIIVDGHKWSFLASTSDGSKTTLWADLPLGTTQQPLGVYSIVCCLQYLSRWIATDYWAAFQRLLSPTPTPAPTPNPTPNPTG